jgi:hypothetical protein
LVGNSLVLACLLGAVSLAAESYYRFVCVEIDSFGMSLPARRWFALHTKLNSLGCRDVEWTREKPEGVRRIALVGDSFTYGWGIERVEDRFSDRVQVRFDETAPGTVEVLNVAKPGWGTGDQLQPIRDMVERFGVDEVVLCYVPNDIEALLPRSADFDPTQPPDPPWLNPDSSYLFTHLYQTVWLPRVETVRGYHDWLAEGLANPDLRRQHQGQLGAIISYCRDRGVALRVVLLPFIRTGGTKYRASEIHTDLAGFFKANGVPVLDLLPVVAGHESDKLIVNRRDPHPNEFAHRLFGDALWRGFYRNEGP